MRYSPNLIITYVFSDLFRIRVVYFTVYYLLSIFAFTFGHTATVVDNGRHQQNMKRHVSFLDKPQNGSVILKRLEQVLFLKTSVWYKKLKVKKCLSLCFLNKCRQQSLAGRHCFPTLGHIRKPHGVPIFLILLWESKEILPKKKLDR